MSSAVDPSDSPRSSLHSIPPTTSPGPAWKQPKAPISPHRLAKLANALGVSTPIPASLNNNSGTSSFLSRSFSESGGPPDHLRRSPTPSAVSSIAFSQTAPATSKFLLHVVPPTHLPHDSDALNDSDMTPPPASASGYHTQFRRGTLVPVHPTLQGQLGAIAKEYALPSTAGLILYLVNSGTASGMQSPLSPGMKPSPLLDDEMHEPGPRLSDDIWRHLWARVVQAEQREMNMLQSRSPTPLTLSAYAAATPFLNQEFGPNLRPPPISTSSPGTSPISPRPSYLGSLSPSPPRSISDMRFNTKSAPPSSASATQSEFDVSTPDTSINGHGMRADSLDLPGLHSPSLIPILAKVEFDIDKKRAGWYEPWVRSRKVNHAKRARSRKNSAATVNSEPGEEAKAKVPPMPLLIGRKETASPFEMNAVDPSQELGAENDEDDTQVSGYEQLSDTQEGDSDSEEVEIDEFAEDTTMRASLDEKTDPLEDVFGSDADTWTEMKGERRGTHEFNPNVVNLALTAGDLDDSSQETDENDSALDAPKEEDEVRELLDQLSQSGDSTPDIFASFSPESVSKKIPPPLVIVPNSGPKDVIPAEPSPFAPPSTHLAYLDSPDNHNSELAAVREFPAKSPAEEKRAGALFEDLDLGLDPSDDFDDPNDRRKSQIMMSAQLDEIERTLAQLSPHFLKPDLEEDQSQGFQSMSALSPNSTSPLRSAGFTPSSPPEDPPNSAVGASWPAVPFSQIKDTPTSPKDPNRPPSPPQLTLNGVTTGAPRSYNPRTSEDEVSSETTQRRKKLEEEQAFFRKPFAQSPVIPLSPDPFGRFASSTPEVPPTISEPVGWDTTTQGRASISLGDGENNKGLNAPQQKGRARSGTTSRFSVDSVAEEDSGPSVVAPAKSNRGTLMSVKSIKNLWRKSNKGDKAEKGSNAMSGRGSPGVPQRPERPSQETMDLPDVPPLPPLPANGSFGRISPQPPVDMTRRPSQPGSPSIPRAPSAQSNLESPSLDRASYSSPEIPGPLRSPSSEAPSPVMAPGLSAPPYTNATRNNTSPIIPAQMLANRPGANLANLRFDQESPYPNPVRTSPPQPPPQPQQLQQQQQGLESIPEQDGLVRRSNMQYKTSISSNGSGYHYSSQNQDQQSPNQRMSFDRMSNTSGRTSGSGSGSYGHGQGSIGRANGRKTSVNSLSSDLAPPAPLRTKTPVTGELVGGASPSTSFGRPGVLGDVRSASPATSFASSHASIDESQFEIVSPRLNGGFAQPPATQAGQVVVERRGS